MALLVWPRHGVVARVLRVARLTERVRLEDALKHLHHEARQGRTGTLESLAGMLEISRARVAGVVERLDELGLARASGDGIVLTDEGRDYALRILRTHRLWERYLADRTGVAPADWHEEAERQEHVLSRDETEALAARMGHPLYDPHGDPIPTAAGELPPTAGTPLTSLRAGQHGTIVHLEDEPKETFHKLVQAGLSLDMPVEVLDASAHGVRFRAGGAEHQLTALEASNVTVRRGETDAADEARWGHTLAELSPGEAATVVGIAPACQGPQRRRLLDLGVVPGTEITAEMRSAGGDPVAYRIRGALIARRRQQAEWGQVAAPASARAKGG